MTRLDAEERAIRIWGEEARVTRSNHTALPGQTEWLVNLPNGGFHSFDCNGHPTCHHECDEASVQVCP